jgi:outer membrane receptor protein involved in Fe transport
MQYTRTKELKGHSFLLRFNVQEGAGRPATHQSATSQISTRQRAALAWFTLNMRAQYRLSEWLSINAALENILDHHYRTYSSGISAPGRNFVISLNASF